MGDRDLFEMNGNPATDRRPGRGKATVPAIGVLGIVVILIIAAGCIGTGVIGTPSHQQDYQQDADASPIPQDCDPVSFLTADTTIPLSPTPLAIKVPPVFTLTPTPTPPAGIVSYPHIIPDSSRGILAKNYTFRFQDRMISITAEVNKSVYNGAKYADKSVIMNRKGISRRDWAPGYFRAFVEDPYQEALFNSLISAFREIRQEMGLSDDEYLELMAAFAQSIPYDKEGEDNLEEGNRFPVETVIDGRGVCGDKSLLLAGLLSREGYDVVLLVFEPEKHMALGIRCSEGYRNTGYAYLETTRYSFVGSVPEELNEGTSLSSMPNIITTGSGWKGYSAIYETQYIREQNRVAEEEIKRLKDELEVTKSGPDQYRTLVREYNRYVALFNYISIHGYDRPGTFEYVATHASTPPGQAQQISASEPAYTPCDGAGDNSCPAGSFCCRADATCYSPCTAGIWEPGLCVCRVTL